MATPVLADLRYALSDLDRRLIQAGGRLIEDRRTRLRAVARGLPARPEDLLALSQQRLDHAASRLGSGLQRNVALHERHLAVAAGRLSPALLHTRLDRGNDRLGAIAGRLAAGLQAGVARHERRLLQAAGRLSPEPLHRRLDQRRTRLDALTARLDGEVPRRLERAEDRLAALSRALATLDPARPKPGFARIEASDGAWVTAAAALSAGQAVNLVFGDGARGAVIDGGEERVPAPRPAPRPKAVPPGQGDLF